MTGTTNPTGHRARLRQRFIAEPGGLLPVELLELLLTYAIPRQDVAPMARRLLDRFGSLAGVLSAPYEELIAVSGVGPHTAVLLKTAVQISQFDPGATSAPAGEEQPALFELDLPDPDRKAAGEAAGPALRTFADDEAANSLKFIPQAAQFANLAEFKAYLGAQLPYNSASTRQRRAGYIIERFFPAGRLDVPLTYFAATCTAEQDLKPVLFYHLLKAEPLVAKVAEEFIWPALPLGYVTREAMREFIPRYLPDASPASQNKMLHALYRAYDLLSVGVADGNILRFQVHAGTLESFLYLLTAEFPQPGIYSFEALEESTLRHWLLWDREWMRRQLYNLRDFGIVPKISEIDTIRQFTLQYDQLEALRHYFEHPQRDVLIIREDTAQ